jgi:hypothetical protein
MKLLTIILLITSCSTLKKSNFFDNCSCKQVELTNGITITDSLGKFSYVIPDSLWLPQRSVGFNENGLTVGDTLLGYIRFFNINQSKFTGDFIWEIEQKIIEKEFNVIDKGQTTFKGQLTHWNLVHFDEDGYITLYISHIDREEKDTYTISMTVEFNPDYKQRLCELESFLETFEIIKK